MQEVNTGCLSDLDKTVIPGVGAGVFYKEAKMIRGMEAILLSSQSAKKLAKFYRETVGLKQSSVMEIGDKGEQGFEFPLKGMSIYILDNSKVKGKNKQPARIMFNLEVDDIRKEVARLKKKKVKVVEDIYHIEEYGYVATFQDVDGNHFQFVQTRARYRESTK